MTKSKIIHWFRQDLRLADNPSLFQAAKEGAVLPVFILDDEAAGPNSHGAAARCWLHHSLQSLNNDLGGKLAIYKGAPLAVLKELIFQNEITALHWNRCYEPWRIHRDTEIKKTITDHFSGIVEVKSFNASLLWEPFENLKSDGTPYKVFTPFFKNGCQNALPPRKPLSSPERLDLLVPQKKHSGPARKLTIPELGLLPKIRWDEKILSGWNIGEKAAITQLNHFLSEAIADYKKGRNFPALPNVSRLSPHLHFGEISPNQAWYAAKNLNSKTSHGLSENIETFCSELGWREFSHSQLFHNPEMPTKNLQSKFDHFPWHENRQALKRWQKGQTGVPIIDAGMRELWQTGYMHNRVRMIVASYLVKNLLIHWRHGERWFWHCLFDADLANNSASWQWVTGSGADAAPFFRIFNPITQGQKFDPDASYIRHYVPELANLPNKYIFDPSSAPADILRDAKITLGKSYPKPLIDLKISRERALQSYKMIKQETE